MKPVLAAAIACALLAAGCEREMHNMYEQPRFDPDEGSTLWPDGRADRPPPAGSVPAATGDIAGTSSARQGRQEIQEWREAKAAQSPPPVTQALLQRGQDRYSIYCLPCHSPLGDGEGPVARHGFPNPPTYHQPRLRDAPDRYLFDVITGGHGVMYGYGDRVAPLDRWAIVAYIRALQLSQAVPVAELPPALRDKVAAGGPR
ncbi:c-type cytochrome [Ramlibacter humi]|uniref:Cytochrome c n=1 Tax=Ramlibacter humi TaxID=2530451 RepID=A0A4Z0BEF0_9BURK|nr:cytochrome c [Ramlibacter humi]TFY97200.1 cytochrome c [Ramlibacter humi]